MRLLVGYAQLTNTRVLALLGDPDASAYELLFSFASPEEKNQFLNLVRSNEDMGNDYITELTPPTTEEIRNALPLATVIPEDAFTHAMLIAATPSVRGQRMIVLCPNASVHRFRTLRKALAFLLVGIACG